MQPFPRYSPEDLPLNLTVMPETQSKPIVGKNTAGVAHVARLKILVSLILKALESLENCRKNLKSGLLFFFFF